MFHTRKMIWKYDLVFMYTFYGTDYKLKLIRYVDGTPTSEVTPVTICYMHTPHHGCPYVMVMVINDRLASLSFHASQPSHSSNKAISNCELQGVDKDLGHIAHPVSNRCTSFWFHINWTKHSWDLSNRVLDLEKNTSEILKENLAKKGFQQNS